MTRKTFRIEAQQTGKRLDKAISELTGLGRRRIRELFLENAIQLDDARERPSALTRQGQCVAIELEASEHDAGSIETPPLCIVLETPSLVIVDKPAGQPSVPARARGKFPAQSLGTLAFALSERFPEMRGVGYSPLEAGLLHRLDTQTSGLMLAARSRRAFETLQRALSQDRIEKRYYAVVRSDERLVPSTLTAPLKPDPKNPRKVMVCHPDDPRANSAETVITPLRRGRDWTLLDVKAPRAYRHQIRAHLAELGFPLAGDVLYGAKPEPLLGARHALHAHYVAWAGDDVVTAFLERSPVPDSFGALVR